MSWYAVGLLDWPAHCRCRSTRVLERVGSRRLDGVRAVQWGEHVLVTAMLDADTDEGADALFRDEWDFAVALVDDELGVPGHVRVVPYLRVLRLLGTGR